MSEYQLKFTEEPAEDNRQEVLDELIAFMRDMEGLTMTVVTLDTEQSDNWDKDGEGEFDYQDYYGQQIIQQIREIDADAECLVIRNQQLLPVAMASSQIDSATGSIGWQGIGIEKRLRNEISNMIGLDDYQLEAPIS